MSYIQSSLYETMVLHYKKIQDKKSTNIVY